MLTSLSASTFVAGAATVSLTSSADTFLTAGSTSSSAGVPDGNYGGAGALQISAAGSAKGEIQTLLRFELLAAKNNFDSLFGANLWAVDKITLQLGTNFGTADAQPNNPIFNTIKAGIFKIDWQANDNWGEGAGNPNSPEFPTNAPVDGATFNSLGLLKSSADRTVGTFTYTPVGNTSPPSIPPAVFSLTLDPSMLADVTSGSALSLRGYAGDASVSYLFNARSFGTAANRPTLIVSAQAVPEPAALGLLLAGAAGLALARPRHAGPV